MEGIAQRMGMTGKDGAVTIGHRDQTEILPQTGQGLG